MSRSSFDRFADLSERVVSSAPFFTVCVALVIGWVPSILVIRSVDTWQLIINTITTIVTFLLVALIQNTQARFEDRVDKRLDEICTMLKAREES